jgi:16S rRNA (uracil1498-N3)-methyltransferase
VVERRRESGVASFFVDSELALGGVVELSDGATRHAHVRRLGEGDEVRLVNGRGMVARGRLTPLSRRTMTVAIEDRESVDRPSALALVVPVADRDRMLWLAEKATECAITAWQPVVFERSRSVSPRGEGEAFARKIRARMIGALEQSGGAWLPDVDAERGLGDVAAGCSAAQRFVLDRDGGALSSCAPFGPMAIVVGPEGGLAGPELDLLIERGWRTASLGTTTLRFETAGIAAAAIVRAHQGR